MNRSAKQIASEIHKVLTEATSRDMKPEVIEKGDFVFYQRPELGQWLVTSIEGENASISDPDGKELTVKLSQLDLAEKKLTEEDFEGMDDLGPLDAFDDQIDAMPLDQLKDMPAQEKGLLGVDMDAITGDVDADIDSTVYDASVEKDAFTAGEYQDDEAQDAGYPSKAFAGGLRESKDYSLISEGARYHIEEQIPLSVGAYRYGSNKFIEMFSEFRLMESKGQIEVLDETDKWMLQNTDIGEWGEYEGMTVPLDLPIAEGSAINEAEYQGRKVQLNKPKRGGSKKFYVYVRSKKGNVKKVSFGAKSGGQKLSVKIKDPKARKAFADRHSCSTKKDKTKAGYWSCNLPRYGKALGFGTNMNTYW